MKLLRNASIRRKQTLIITLTTAAALLLACAAFATYEVISFRTTMLRDLTTMGEIIGDNCASAIDFNDAKGATEALTTLKDEPNIVAACVYSKDGKIFAVYDRANDGRRFVPPPYQASGHYFGKWDLVLFDPIDYKGDTVGVIYIASDIEGLHAKLRQYAVIAGGVFLLSLAGAFFLSTRVQRIISGPILELVNTTHAVARDHNYSLRAVKRNQDELGALTDGFNEMLAQIQARDTALKTARESLEQRVEERTRELANSFSLLNATLESTSDGILVIDRNDRVVSFNAKFAEMWRVPRENIVAGEEDKILPLAVAMVKDSEAFLSKVRELYAHPEASSQDVIELLDGRVFERDSQPQRLNGECIGRVWCFRDITERKRAEAALAETSSLMEMMLENSPDYIYFKDRESRFIYSSRSLAQFFGLSDPALLKGKTDADFYVSDRAGTALEDELEILRTGRTIIGKQETGAQTNGRVDWALTSKMPWRDKEGNIIGTFGISKDMTEIKETEAELELAHKQLVDASRQAGMAEVATSVLHNVGNVLNSVNISGSIVSDKVRNSKVLNLAKAVALIEAQKHDLGRFMTEDSRGKQLPAYLSSLSVHLAAEREEMLKELSLLTGNIEHIKEIVAMQQSYARVSGIMESHKVVDLIEDALRMNAGALDRHQVKVIRDYQQTPVAVVDKHKLLQILVNLIRNAKYALDDGMPPVKQLTLRVSVNGDERVKIAIIDNGVGIPPENLTRIFAHGFTTRKEGHGFGLHSGALAAREMGGALSVHSEGSGKGAVFTIEFPSRPAKAPAA